MSGKATTYTINFKAQFEDIKRASEVLQNVQKEIDSGSLKATDAQRKKILLLQNEAKSLVQILGEKMSPDGTLSAENLKLVSDAFTQLLKGVGQLRTNLIQMAAPEKLKQELNQIISKIEEIEIKKKEISQQKNTKTNPEFAGYKIDKEAGTASLNKNFKDVSASKNTVGLNAISGSQIKTYKQLEAAVQLLNKAQDQNITLTNRESAALKGMLPNADKYKAAFDQVNLEYEEAEKSIPLVIQKYKDLVSQYEALNKELAKLKSQQATQEDLIQNTKEITAASKNAINDISGIYNKLDEGGKTAANELEKNAKAQEDAASRTSKILGTTTTDVTDKTQKLKESILGTSTSFGKAFKNVITYGSALSLLRGLYNKLISTIKEMDTALTNMTVVTQLTREQAWNLTGTLQDLAKQTGMTSTEIANMTTMYLQQGKTLSDSLKLTEAAAKAARIAGISGSDSINLLTNAMNGFQLKASQAMEVSDKFAALAASAATDYEELATALSKVASQANLAGMSMDFTLGLLTKGIETTREAPETIGTALKTVIARMRELTDYGETLEDGIDVNRVDTALSEIGVSLLDQNREFRNLDEVLTEVGQKWDTLSVNQQANVAVALAGTRQQSRLIAMMQDFDRTQELVNISMTSAGATAAQHRKYMEGLEAATTRLTTGYQQLITEFSNSDFVINFMNALSTGVEYLSNNIGVVYSALGGIAAIMGVIAISKLKEYETSLLQLHIEQQIRQLQLQKYLEETQTAEVKQNASVLEIKNKLKEIEYTEKEIIAERKLRIDILKTNLARAQGADDQEAVKQITQDLTDTENSLNKSIQDNIAIEGLRKQLTEEEKTSQIAHNKTLHAQNLLGLADNKLSLEQRAQTITQMGLEAMGINSTTAAVIAENAAKVVGWMTTKAKGKASKDAAKEGAKEAGAALVDAGAQTVDAGAKGINTVATKLLESASNSLSIAISAIPIVGWIAGLISLAAVLAIVVAKTGAAAGAFDAFKGMGKSLISMGKSFVEVWAVLINLVAKLLMFNPQIMLILGLVMFYIKAYEIYFSLIAAVMEIIVAIIQELVSGVQILIQKLINLTKKWPWLYKAITGTIKVIKVVINFISKLPGYIDKLSNWITNAIGNWWDTAEEKSDKAAKKIAKNQEKIYDNKQKLKTLEPLINEYEELSKKVNKTAEDIQRLGEIEEEIKGLDESYILSNGGINTKQAQADIKKMKDENEKLLKDNYESAIKGINSGIVKEDHRTGLSDYYMEKALSEGNDALGKDFQTTMQNLTDEELKALNKIEGGYKQLFGAMKSFTQNSSDTLAEQFVVYEESIKSLPEEAKVAFNRMYSIYATYGQMINSIGLSKQSEITEFLNVLDKMKMSEAELQDIIEAYVNKTGGTEEDALLWIAKTIQGQENGAIALINAASVLGGDDKELANAVEKATTDSNQEIIENYMKESSRISNIADFSKKMANGTITPEEIRTLEQEYPEVFNEETWEKFKSGNYDLKEELQAAADATIKELDARLAIESLTDKERKAIEAEKEALQYSWLYSSELYKNMADNTKEMVEQERVQNRINQLTKELENITDPEERNKKTQELVEAYGKIRDIYSDVYNDPMYQKLVDGGYIIDGKVVATGDEIKALFGQEGKDFINKYGDIIDDAAKSNKDYVDGLRSVVELEYDNQIEVLEKQKEQYEKYFDKLDALEEEQERSASRESILSQLSSIAGGSDAASNSLRKDLLNQLTDLNKEEAEARKQAIRDAALESIDKTVAAIERQIDELNGLTEENLKALLSGLGFKYDSGGLVKHTGHAWVHGTSTRPEAFLSAADTQLIANLVSSLNYGSLQSALSIDSGATGGVVIENVNISTNELNSDQDFRNSAQIFAEEFNKVMRQRGINRNVNK